MYKDHLPHGVSACRFLLTALCILLFAGNLRAAGDEEYMRKKISVQATNESIEQVLDKISKLADIRFFYNYSVLDFSRKITVNIKDTELHDALSKVLQGEKVEIEYQPNRTVVLRPQRVPDGISAINISGKIIDADTKEPLIGASVVLKEQKGVGVVTDIDGKFHITIPEGGASALLISYVGYENEELAITGQGDMKDLTIKMTAAFVEMEGVEVRVYGTSFNVNTHQKGNIQTVLVKGSIGVKVLSSGMESVIRPGQMAEFKQGNTKVDVKDVNVAVYTDWKDGIFRFENQRLEDILAVLSNWYDMNVFYQTVSVKELHFSGYMERYKDVSVILEAITLSTGVTFSIQGKTIIVSK